MPVVSTLSVELEVPLVSLSSVEEEDAVDSFSLVEEEVESLVLVPVSELVPVR